METLVERSPCDSLEDLYPGLSTVLSKTHPICFDMQTGTEDDGIEQVDGENSVNRRTFVQGGGYRRSTSLLDNEEARQQLDLGNSAHGSGRTRRFTIHAIEVDIVYNRFGLHQPNGVMYWTRTSRTRSATSAASGETPDDAFSLVENETASAEQRGNPNEDDGGERSTPRSSSRWSFIRANEGDTIQIRSSSITSTGRRQSTRPPCRTTSRHPTVWPSGSTPTRLQNRGTVQYRWEATHGHPLFYDGANQAVDSANEPPEEANLLSRDCSGLSRSNRRERRGATLRPAANSTVGTKAVIDDPNGLGTTYREFVPFYHTPEGIEPEVQWPSTGEEQTIHAINYRADPLGQRDDEFYNSWTNGDPGGGDNVFPAYKGDPIKYTFVGASGRESRPPPTPASLEGSTAHGSRHHRFTDHRSR